MNLLFDLDGTLTDPVVGITRCIQHALRKLGQTPAAEQELARFVGPPLRGTFATLLGTTDEALLSRAIDLYRERFESIGMLENKVYPDVTATLDRLAAEGHRIWVATSKPRVYARSILGYFGLEGRIHGIYGSELDGRNTEKADLIREILRNERLLAPETWMIGDRAQDIRGGRANGTRTAGALWGYGTEEELRSERPDALVRSIRDLPDQLKPDLR